MTSTAPSKTWSWETDETYSPYYTAEATEDGLSYSVIIGGPSGGPGMAGFQSYAELLAGQPINQMPAAIEAEVREYARAMIARDGQVQLRWELASDGLPPDHQLAYVSADLNGKNVGVRVLEEDSTIVFEGSLPAGKITLGLTAGFGRPWRRPGARTADCELEVACAAGSSTVVRCTAKADLTFTTDVTVVPASSKSK